MAWHEQHDDDPENDEYILDVDTLPSLEEHVCCATEKNVHGIFGAHPPS